MTSSAGPTYVFGKVGRSPSPEPTPGWLVAVGAVVLAVGAVIAAVYDVLYTPTRIGRTLIWISVPMAVAGNVLLTRLGRLIQPRSPLLAALPVVVWTIAVFVMVNQRREGDVFLPQAPTDLMYAGYVTIFAGMLAGAVTLGLTAPRGTGSGGVR